MAALSRRSVERFHRRAPLLDGDGNEDDAATQQLTAGTAG